MSQDEVIEFLKARPNDWFRVQDIAEQTGLNINSIKSALKHLYKKWHLVKFKLPKKNTEPWLWQYNS